MGAAMGAHPVAFLTEVPAGRAVGGAGILLDVAGVLWVQRILRTARRL
jgi:Flp pilus assembly protein TadB